MNSTPSHDLVERMRVLEVDHGPDGWPAVQMRDISALCDEVDRLRKEVDQLELAELGAQEAFGVVVQDKRDLEKEVKRLTDLLRGAHQSIWEYANGKRFCRRTPKLRRTRRRRRTHHDRPNHSAYWLRFEHRVGPPSCSL